MSTRNETIDAATVPVTGANGTPATGLFDRLPEWVLDSLSNEQRDAIHQAAEDPAWKRSPVDIRVTIPFLGKKFFITVVSGSEKRSPERRDQERHHYPVRTAANIFFFIGLATLFYVAAMVALALQSAIIEF
ncbi:MAG: hypothetical protein O3A85_02385 [Proteobacteria bacterium]|nr:hypothetical protein [Pseudomonadota bacterium]